MIEMLPLLVAVLGLVMLFAYAVTLLTMGLRWFPAVLWCWQCGYHWEARDKSCPRCATKGRTAEPVADVVPTEKIPVVPR